MTLSEAGSAQHQLQQRRQDVSSQSHSALRQSTSHADRVRSEESWVEIASEPSSSSLSSAAEDIITTGLRVEHSAASRRRRARNAPTSAALARLQATQNGGGTSSQEEFDESESESDRVMTSSNEGLVIRREGDDYAAHDSEDENRTAVNYPIRRSNLDNFTPQPNAFSHPPSSRAIRHASEPCPGSYFPQMPARNPPRPAARHSFSSNEANVQHSPFNIISPSRDAAAHHDAALRASLSTLLSCAAAARGLSKVPTSQSATQRATPQQTDRIAPATLRLVPESALPHHGPSRLAAVHQQSSTATSSAAGAEDDMRRAPSPDARHKRKSGTRSRNTSKERAARHNPKKARRSSSASSVASTVYGAEEMFISPTLLTWVVSAGVVVVLSAISFTAGYAVGHEAGRIEGVGSVVGTGGSEAVGCAAEAGRSGLGLRRLRFAVQA